MFQNLLKVLALFLFVNNTILSQQTLQYNLKVNDTFTFLQKSDQNIVQTIDGNKHVMDNSMESIFTFYVKKVTDSSYIMSFSFDKFVMNTHSNLYGELFNVNTDSIVTSDTQSRMFMILTETPLSLEMLKTGKIISLKGTDALVKKMIDGAGFENEFTKAVMTEYMKKEFGRNKMINSLEQFTFIYTKKPVSINDSWQNSLKGNLNSENTWKLKSSDKNKATITGTSTIAMQTQDESTEMTLKGTSNASVNCNKINGTVVNMVVESSMEGKTILKNMGSTELPTTIISKTTYKALKNVQQTF